MNISRTRFVHELTDYFNKHGIVTSIHESTVSFDKSICNKINHKTVKKEIKIEHINNINSTLDITQEENSELINKSKTKELTQEE